MRLALILSLAAYAQRPVQGLQNGAARVEFDLGGGSLTVFQLTGGVNPLHWIGPADVNVQLRPMAHFLCLDRWGQPSAEELANGMPFHGEATRVLWKVDASSAASVTMSAHLPMANMDVKRTAVLSENSALLRVSETVTNRNKLGKIYNMVQHPSIGPPFLDERTIVDANARQGFARSAPRPHPEVPSSWWPLALRDGVPVDVRFLTNDPNPNVASYVVDEAIGWTTASGVSSGTMLGYLWKSKEYPWFNAWRHVDGANKPLARGLEFGTTGLHQPFATLIEVGRIFGRRLSAYLEPGASETRSYIAFVAKIPSDWKGTDRVTLQDGTITVFERGTRTVTISGAAW